MKSFLKNRSGGFTLIEMMIVVAVIAILAVVAIPKFADLMSRAREADVHGSLSTLRSAISIYYSDNHVIPITLEALEASQRYVNAVPVVKIPSNNQNNPGHALKTGSTTALDDGSSAGWIYISDNQELFQIHVNCSHNDSKGFVWSAF